MTPPKAPPQSGPVTVLLVDDDQDCRMLMRDAIEQGRLNKKICEVSNGAEALRFLHREGPYAGAPRPELIYLDIEMPEMTGQEVLAAVKNDPELRDIPVVMMTGLDDDNQKQLAARNGANSYTLKSTDPLAFLQTVLAVTNYWLCVHQYPDMDNGQSVETQ